MWSGIHLIRSFVITLEISDHPAMKYVHNYCTTNDFINVQFPVIPNFFLVFRHVLHMF